MKQTKQFEQLTIDRDYLRGELEVFADLYGELYRRFGSGELDFDDYPDSRSHVDTVLGWTLTFQTRHAATDWSEVEYLDTIDAFADEVIKKPRRS